MNRGRSLLEQTVTGRTRILEDVHLGPRPGLLIRVFDTIEADVGTGVDHRLIGFTLYPSDV